MSGRAGRQDGHVGRRLRERRPSGRLGAILARLTAIALGAASLVGCSFSLHCRAGDSTCKAVESRLDDVRANEGEACATPTMTAYLTLKRLGEAAAPYLVESLSAGDDAVASLAARLLDEMGHGGEVAAWCTRAHEGRSFCQGPR